MHRYELLIAPFVGWALAQGIKFVLTLRKDGLQWRDLVASGGFPSSHTACVMPLVVIVGLRQGIDSPMFAVVAIFSAIVMYDSMGVRRSSGEQAVAIQEVARKTSVKLSTKLHAAKGHTPIEVLGGVVLGVAIGLLSYVIF